MKSEYHGLRADLISFDNESNILTTSPSKCRLMVMYDDNNPQNGVCDQSEGTAEGDYWEYWTGENS